jgi:hypothetical protein
MKSPSTLHSDPAVFARRHQISQPVARAIILNTKSLDEAEKAYDRMKGISHGPRLTTQDLKPQ